MIAELNFSISLSYRKPASQYYLESFCYWVSKKREKERKGDKEESTRAQVFIKREHMYNWQKMPNFLDRTSQGPSAAEGATTTGLDLAHYRAVGGFLERGSPKRERGVMHDM